jgi:hypothetical protein
LLQKLLDVGPINEVIENLRKELIRLLQVHLPNAVGDVHEILKIVKHSMFCLIYPIPIGRYDAYLVHHCLDLCNTHLHSMPILRIAIVNLMKQLIQLFSKYFLLFYGLIPTEELT